MDFSGESSDRTVTKIIAGKHWQSQVWFMEIYTSKVKEPARLVSVSHCCDWLKSMLRGILREDEMFSLVV